MSFTPEQIEALKSIGALNEDATSENSAPVAEEPAPVEPASVEPAEPNDTPDEPLGEAGLKALRAERDARTKAESELKSLSGLKGQLTKTTNQLSEVQSERDSLASELARHKVALTHGLSAEDMEILPAGLSEEALERIAVRISTSNSPRRPAPDANQGKTGAAPTTPQEEFKAFLESSFGGL